MSGKIAFEVETARVLEILSKEIYDSPLALLRENLQNAYDATLTGATLTATNPSPASDGIVEQEQRTHFLSFVLVVDTLRLAWLHRQRRHHVGQHLPRGLVHAD